MTITPYHLIISMLVIGCLTSVVSAGLYWWDKRAAGKERRRVSERTLLLWGLLGGWPGSLWARRQFRHKTQKQPFGLLLWLSVIVNLAIWGGLIWWITRLWLENDAAAE